MPARKKDENVDLLIEALVGKLKELREEKGFTTAALAIITGIAQPNITRMETGQVKPNVSTVIAIANALDADVIVKKRPVAK